MTLQFRLACFAVPLSLLWLAPAAPGENAAAEPPIAPDSGYTVQLCGQCRLPRVVEIAASGKRPFVAKEQPKVVEAGLGAQRDASLAGAFKAEWICASATPPCTVQGMRLTVDDSIQRAGTYTVVISLQPSSQPLLPRWKLDVVQSPAQLDVQPITITRYRYWFGDDMPPLVVRNGSDSALLTLKSAGQWDAASSQGRIEISAALPEIKPKDSATLHYTLAGDFPEGKVTHTLRFDAPQLTAPATVNLDVDTKWSGWFLWAAVVLGLGAGFYVKVILRNRIDLANARVQADGLLKDADGAWNRIQDPDFRDAIDTPRGTLRTARTQTDLAAIKNAHDALAEALKDATVSHATRLQDARKALEGFRAVLKPDWRVPPAVVDALRAARNALAAVDEALGNFNAKDAQDRVDALRDHLAEELRAAYGQWPDVQQTVVRLASANAGIPARVVKQMEDEMQKAPQGWQTIRVTPIPAADSDIVATLADYEPKFAFVNGVLTSLVNRLEREWTDVVRILDPIRPRLPAPAALAPLEQQWRELIAQLRRGGQDAHGVLDVSDNRLRDLQQAWLSAYQNQPPAPDAAMVLQIGNREFVLATTTLANHFLVSGRVLGGVDAPPGWPSTRAQAGAGGAPTPATPAQATPWFPYVQPFEPSPTDVIRRSQLIQSAVVLILMTISLSLGAVTANHGAWADLFHAFTLSFAADVTLDALLARLKT